MWDVFISYAREDRGVAEPIKGRLENLGLRVFFDIDGAIEAGDSFPQRITDAITRSRVVLAVWTPAALSRDWCRREAFLARQLGTLLPVAAKQISPIDLKEFIDASYESLIDLDGQDQHFGWSQTLASIGRRLQGFAVGDDEELRLKQLAEHLLLEAQRTRPPALQHPGTALGLSSAGSIWERLRYSSDRDDLLRFAETFPGTVEAFEARRAAAGVSLPSAIGRSMQEIWTELSTSNDEQDVQRFADTFLGVAEGLEARRRVPYLKAQQQAYRAVWDEIEHVCLDPDQQWISGESDLRASASASQRMLPVINAFNDQWPGNPWTVEFSWIKTRFEQASSINLRRALIWEEAREKLVQEKAREQLAREKGQPPEKLSMLGRLANSATMLVVALVLIPSAAVLVWAGLTSQGYATRDSVIAGVACMTFLYFVLIGVHHWRSVSGALDEYERKESDYEREAECEAVGTMLHPLWGCLEVQSELIESLVRYRSDHGAFTGETLWPDEHVLRAWADTAKLEGDWESRLKMIGFELVGRKRRDLYPVGQSGSLRMHAQMQSLKHRLKSASESLVAAARGLSSS